MNSAEGFALYCYSRRMMRHQTCWKVGEVICGSKVIESGNRSIVSPSTVVLGI